MSYGPDSRGALAALNRFGLGARGGVADDFRDAASDPRGFVKSELSRPGGALLESFELASSQELISQLYDFQLRQKLARERAAEHGAAGDASQRPQAAAASPSDEMAAAPSRQKRPAPNVVQRTYQREAVARLQRACEAEVGFLERLVAFWSNHFTVGVNKDPLVRVAAGAFEREAIRPHVLGRFRDMLLAVERHPAMLNYLDNQLSFGPNSRAGLLRNRGLNENLAREAMELHTLGVDGGYTQADVTSFAKILTGWTIVGPLGQLGRPGSFAFFRAAHEPGPQTLLGEVYPDAGLAQGEAALDDLSRRPATARFIATKLARHFVADDPPKTLVESLAKTFRETDGDLREVSLALVSSDEAWRAPLTKIRDPHEFVVAAFRLFGRQPQGPQPYLGFLNVLGMPLWNPPGPNGFSDSVAAWCAPEGLKLRLDVAARLGAQEGAAPFNPNQLVDVAFGSAASKATREAVARAESKAQGFALLLMSPEFQRR